MKVIVPLNFSSTSELKTALLELNEQVDMIEIWLDQIFQEFLQNPILALEVRKWILEAKQKFGLEVLAVCKQTSEKGKFPGNSHQRVQILNQFLQLGGDFVDVDINQNSSQDISHISNGKCWLSFHDFEGANIDTIRNKYEEMKSFSPFLYKFAVTPKNENEIKSFVAFAKDFPEPRTIFTTMGSLGSQGRSELVKHTWGGFFALNEELKTASGQPTLNDLKSS